ncbi:TonB-dependent hemoglobin/transferrin/lactoferrin family receptor [Roseibacterium beibuensis]|uniref:TonB-dependent hemoglobin/transferrin/lactoferrin family receptor n=1 Tax=[Roseibacterium] beibuensis TaxID=1193142 RepID=UPI00217E8F16|nr:TonB-dependent hemoglobin/transferrin/lactoferrin family receptor [Roseibacterium beibuensis]MCS6627226.1 TonB-dependent hemoglobin/transferrin/lactoferrin family receptor [Roseibacterium beibuensis]
MRTLLLNVGLAALVAAAGPALANDPSTVPGSDDPTQLPPVSVLATRTETRTDEAPATVTVITADQIETELATDIKDLVRFEPGVSVVSQPARFGAALGTTGRAGNEGFTIRGMGGDRVLIVVDGVRVPDGFVFGAQSVGRGGYADLDLMRSVEILRGAASALYGSDGVAGAVAFTTKDPSDLLRPGESFGARGRVGYNSADEGLTTSAVMAGSSGNFSGLLAWTGRDGGETETQGTVGGEGSMRTRANPMENGSDAFLAKAVWEVAPGHSLRAGYDWFEGGMTAEVLSGRSATVLQLLADDTTTRSGWNLGWRGDDVLGLERGQITAYGQEAESRQFTFEDREPAVDRTRDNTFDNEVFGVSADFTRALGPHRLTFGGDWSETTQQGVRDGTVPPFGETFPTSAFPKTDYTLGGVFLQDEIRLLGDDLRIIPAVRWDSYELTTADDPLYPTPAADQSGDHVSPKLGVVWWGHDNFGLFANWGEGFKAPTPSQVNNFFGNLAFGYISAPNPDLRPETSRSLEFGARVRDLPLFGGHLSGQAVVFQSNYEDFISQQVVSGSFTPADPAVYQWINFTDVEIQGFEARANAWWDNGMSARFAFAYADGETTSAGATTRLPTTDPIKVVFGLGYDEPAGRFGGQAVVTWSDAKDPSDTDGLGCYDPDPALGCAVGDDFALLDLTAWWDVNDRVTARIGVFNVLDETYRWWSDVRGVAADLPVIDAYTQPGRNVGLSLALRY